jgi:phytoene synthase
VTPDANDDARRRYDDTAYRVAHEVLAAYSTSFGLGTRLLGRRARAHIEAIYALVRVADEIVDTPHGGDAAAPLAELRDQVARARATRWSTNLVVHAFARTAQRVGITEAEIDPFFDSMAMDLTMTEHDRASYERYIHGSAEVVGVMCLRTFLNADRAPGAPLVEPDPESLAGAMALGAAFQKINFLRDLAADSRDLNRHYFPGVTAETFDADTLDAIVSEIGADLTTARAALPRLPGRARSAVAGTLALYERLLAVLADTPPAEIVDRRVRIADAHKLVIAGQAVLLESPWRGPSAGAPGSSQRRTSRAARAATWPAEAHDPVEQPESAR